MAVISVTEMIYSTFYLVCLLICLFFPIAQKLCEIGFSFKSLIKITLMGCLTMVKFNLSVGMRNKELLKELKGKISGESRQQVQEYLSVEPEGFSNPSYFLIRYPNKDCPLLFKEKNVISNQEKYDRDILKVMAINDHQINQYA